MSEPYGKREIKVYVTIWNSFYPFY